MKKTLTCRNLFYCIFLFAGLLLVSCATTANTAEASGEETLTQAGESPAATLSEETPLNENNAEFELLAPEEPAADGNSEKIPDDEVDELNSLLEPGPFPEKIADPESDFSEESLSEKIFTDEKAPASAPEEIFSEKESSSSEENSLPEKNAESVNTPAETKSPAAEIKDNSGAETSAGTASVTQKTTSSQNGSDLNLTNTNSGNKIENKNNSGQAENADASAGAEIPLETGESAKEDPPLPSRSMTVKNNQFVDIVYPGTGWIYLGEVDRGGNFIFQGRKLGKGETTFTLRSKKSGKALLHFYKNDGLTGNYIDDYIEINIGDQNAADAIHVTAPSYAEAVPPKYERNKKEEKRTESENNKMQSESKAAEKSERESGNSSPAERETDSQTLIPDSGGGQKDTSASSEPNEKVQTVIQTNGADDNGDSKKKTSVAASPETSAKQLADTSVSAQGGDLSETGRAGSLLEQAKKAYDEKRYADALELVQQFFDVATGDFDAGLYLEGLILEAKSDVRNIKSAIDAYDTLIKNWPQSNYWRRANERSIYLKRFYIDIR